ncbi:MAG TPA: tetratricopeptide repeat protein, partial [Polyangiaceae bacterium]|nr:tetratricopeptide repeat protein [Polyangiaceae bacterium]
YPARILQARLTLRLGQTQAANQLAEAATRADEGRPEAWKLRSDWARTSGDPASARSFAARALAGSRGLDRDELLRTLRETSLDLNDTDAATNYQKELAKGAAERADRACELGLGLLERGHGNAAVTELKRVARSRSWQGASAAAIELALGRAEMATQDDTAAEATLRRAAQAASGSAGLLIEIDRERLALARRRGRLAELLAEFSRGPRNAARLRLIGHGYEELGDSNQALEAYRSAATTAPSDADAHLDLLRVLESNGDLLGAEREYAVLARLLPSDVPQSIRYMNALLSRGKRREALSEFERVERFQQDSEGLLALADFAERLEEPERSRAILERLERSGGSDPAQLVELGSRFYREGRVDKARATWRRIPDAAASRPPRERAQILLSYALVLFDHDDVNGGLETLARVEPLVGEDTKLTRALALAYERAATASSGVNRSKLTSRAVELWLALLGRPLGGDARDEAQRDEARRHVARAWQRQGSAAQHEAELRRRFEVAPTDVETGKLLAEVSVARGQTATAEKALTALLAVRPADRSSLRSLAELQERQGRMAAALDTWDRLLAADPDSLRGQLEHLVRLAVGLHQDARALAYAERNVAEHPDDGAGLARLAELYRTTGQLERARTTYERALRLDPSRSALGFVLFDLEVGRGDYDAAFRLAARLVESTPDDEVVARASQAVLGLVRLEEATAPERARSRLEELERLLTSAQLNQPARTVFRSQALRVFDAERERAERLAQRAELERLGKRAVATALTGLRGNDVAEQRLALGLLVHAPTAQCAPALLEYARGVASEELRVQALGALRGPLEPAVVTAAFALLDERAEVGARVSQAAAQTLGRLAPPSASGKLAATLDHSDPIVAGHAALGLARLAQVQGFHATPSEVAKLERWLQRPGSSPGVHAAALLAWAQLGHDTRPLQVALDDAEPLVAAVALRGWIEARPGDSPALSTNPSTAPSTALSTALAEALLDGRELVREAAVGSAARWIDRQQPALVARGWEGPLGDPADLEGWLRSALTVPAPTEKREQAFVRLVPEYGLAAARLLEGSSPDARALLERWLASERAGASRRCPLEPEGPGDSSEVTAARKSLDVLLAPSLLDVAHRPDENWASLGLALLPLDSERDEPARWQLLRDALFGRSETLRAAALERLLRAATPPAIRLLSELGTSSPSWSLRRHIASELGTLRSASSLTPEARRLVDSTLQTMTRDSSEVVARAARRGLEAAGSASEP